MSEVTTIEAVGAVAGVGATPTKIEGYLRSPVFLEQAQKLVGSLKLAERMARCAVTYIGLLTPEKRKPIMAASPESLVKVVLGLAEIGLELGRDADLVPRGGQVCGSIRWEGYVRAARSSGQIKRVWSDVIREGETYAVNSGSDGSRVQHSYALPRKGEIVGAYACAEWTDGTIETVVRDRDYLDRCRKASPVGLAGPWGNWFDQMSMAKMTKLVCKRIPLGAPERPETSMMMAAIDADAAPDMDFGGAEELPATPAALPPADPEPKPARRSRAATGNGTEAALRTRIAKACAAAGYKPEETAALIEGVLPGHTLDTLNVEQLQGLAAQVEEPALAKANLDAIRNLGQ